MTLSKIVILIHPNLRGDKCTVQAFQLTKNECMDVAVESLSVPEELLLGRSQKNPISNQASVAGAHTHSGHMANLPSSAVLFTAQ